jgi:hypothetical protein
VIPAKNFFGYLGSGEPDPERVTHLAAAFQKMGYRTVERPCLLGFVPFDADTNPVPTESVILQVTTGTEVRLRTEMARSAGLETAGELASERARIFNLLSYTRDSVTITSDPLALLPYYTARWGDGVLVCSSIRHLFACSDVRQEIDDQAVFEFLCCGTALGGRTLHRAVRVSTAGQVIRWERGKGLKIDRSGRTRIPPANPAMAAEVAADGIAGLIRESLSKLPAPGLLPLTGGFDSRLIACFTTSLQLKPRMLTLGYSRHDEIRVARAAAKILDSTTTVFHPPYPDVLELIPLWLECLEGLADAHTLFMGNLLSFPAEEGTPLYHGFIGDTLSGALLNRIPIETAMAPDEIARGAASHFFRGISEQAGEALHLGASVKGAIEGIQAELVTGGAPHQTFTLWNLENIQRRLNGSQLLYIARRFMPAPVFYYRPLMELWLSVPRIALDDRTLLRYLYQRHFPKIASLPHAEHDPRLIPRSLPTLKYLSGWLSRRYARRILRRLKFATEKLEARSFIWALWHGTTPEQRRKELEGLEETFGLFESRFGWDAPRPDDRLWRACTEVEPKQVLLLRRMYLLGEYVKSVPEAASTQRFDVEQGAAIAGG